MKQQGYMHDASNQQIVCEMEDTYKHILKNIPDDEMANIMIEITAEQFCCVSELLMAMLCTYENYGEHSEIDVVSAYTAH